MIQSEKNPAASGRPDYRKDIPLWAREIFFLFYGAFLICSLADKIFPDRAIVHYLFRFAFAIHSPGILFAAGCVVGIALEDGRDFRRSMLKKALACYFCFFVIGFVTEVFVTGHDAYTSIKDILLTVRVPDSSSVFLTLCFAMLLCAIFEDLLRVILSKRILLILISAIGLLLSFIPEGFLGYGLIGTLIGGSTTNATALAYYVALFFGGILFARHPEKGLFRKSYLAYFGILVLFTGVAGILHFKHPAVIGLGIVCACFFLAMTVFLLPIYAWVEKMLVSFGSLVRGCYSSLMDKSRESRLVNILVYYCGYALLFAAVAYFVFFPYIEEGRTLIWYVDGIGQYIPKAVRFMRCMPLIIRDILHGNMNYQQYDFTTGLGGTFTVSHEPVYWLNLLFSPLKVEIAYDTQIMLRYFLSGVTMSIMLRYYKKDFYTCYLCSIAYTFCGYGIYTGTKHGLFLVPMILLPLLIVAMEELISKKRWYLLTVLTAISLLSSYYFLYMNTIALGIYFVVRILCTKEYRNIKTFFTRGLIIVGSYLIGCAIGSVTLFNSFGGYVGSSRSSGGSVSKFLSTTPLFYRPLWLSDFFVGFISDFYSPGLWLRIGLAPLALFAIIFVFTRKRKKEIKPIFLLLTLFCIIPVFGFILNGFSNVSNRWCYIYIVMIIFILAEYIDDFRALSVTETWVMCTVTAFYGLVIYFTLKHRTDTGLGAFGLLALTLLALLLINNEKFGISKKTGRKILMGVVLFSVIFNANLYITNTAGESPHLESYVEKGTAWPKMSATALKYLNEAVGDDDKDGFYRSTNLYTYGNTRSSGMVFGYHDISIFNSTLNGGIVNYNRQMGNSDYNIVSIYSYNFRTMMNELASVKYLGTDSDVKLPLPYGYHKIFEKEEKDGKMVYSIYENDYALPLGYTYDSIVSEEYAESLDAAQKQELTMMSAIVDEETLSENKNLPVNNKPDLTVHTLPVEITDLVNVEMKDGKITIGEGGGSMILRFQGEKQAETYIDFKGDIVFPEDGAEHFIGCNIKAKDVDYNHRFRVDAYSTGQNEYLFNLGCHEEPLDACKLIFDEEGELEYDDISILSQSMETYPERVAALKNESLENVHVENNTVTGTVSTTKDQLLVITLPRQSGWTAYVDGEETKILRANYQYMAIPVTAGKHDIRLNYRLPGQKATLYCTLGGLALFAAIIIFNFLRKRRK